MGLGDIEEASRQIRAMASLASRIETSGLLKSLAKMQEYKDSVEKIWDVADAAVRHADLFRASQTLYGLSETLADAQIHLDLARDLRIGIHSTWMMELGQMPLTTAKLTNTAQLALYTASLRTAHADRILNSIDFGFLEQFRKAQHALSIDLEASLSDFTLSYRSLVESIASVDSLLQLPSFVLPAASLELSTTAYALDVLTPAEHRSKEAAVERDFFDHAEEELESTDLLSLLERVEPSLATMYIGVLEALRGDNPDRARHVLTSLRELHSQLLRKLAPIEEILEWIPKQGSPCFLDSQERPTRYAKLQYILRDFSHKPLNVFVEKGARTFLDLLDVCNRLHKQDPGMTDNELRALTISAESNLIFILRLWETSRE